MTTAITLLLLELLAIVTINSCFCNGSSYLGCIESERQALLMLKKDLEDPSNRLASWIGDGDCCTWIGITCDNVTGNVIELNLKNPYSEIQSNNASFDVIEAYEGSKLVGNVSSSLLDLKHLISLDLSSNNFRKNEIPEFLSFLRNLKYLNLSKSSFSGMIPHQLGNLSNLQYLDLSSNFLSGSIVDELQNLISLRHLDLSENDFNSSIPNWLYKLNHLEYLSLSDNSLQGRIPRSFGRLCNLRFISLSHLIMSQEISEILDILSGCISDKLESLDLRNSQLSGHLTYQLWEYQSLILSDNSISGSIPSSFGEGVSLEVLDLSNNKLNGLIPSFYGNFSSFRILDLSNNELNGSIPSALGEWVSLKILDLSNNELNGSIPSSLGGLLSLKTLDLSDNKLNGDIPLSLGKLSSLTYLDLSNNKLNGTLSQVLANLTKLSVFDASGNSLMLKVNQDWTPPFQLQRLSLRNCHLGPHFPSWIHSQKDLSNLDLSQTGVIDTIPRWFWKYSFLPTFVNLSHNQIYGEIPDLTEARFRSSLDLSSNNLSGQLPPTSYNFTKLDLSNNALSGSIFRFLCYGNETSGIKILNLRNNFLSGELPDCWMNWDSLEVLNLDNNKFVGNLPMSFGALTYLGSLHLRKNNFSGPIPSSLQNFTQLIAIDLGENEFIGNVPTWMGERFSSMMILNLRSNKFHGHLPTQLCQLTSLQILDLAYNNFSGAIPRCISNFSAMVEVDYSADNNIFHFVDFVGGVDEDALLMMKGEVMEYSNTLNLLRVIDLSSNYFSGEIPIEVTNLKALQSLNLSDNLFIGKIPEKIGVMTGLESIDFSMNQLSGEIPQSISNLSFLSRLNLSNNNLIGKIPLGTQLQSFDASSFSGNQLCGPPLPMSCTESEVEIDSAPGGEKDDKNWFYVSMALGFVVGFWGFIGPLLINRRWRYKYCHFLNELGDKLPAL